MNLISYFILFLASLAGAALISGRYFAEAKKLSAEGLREKLEASRSVRSEFKERWYNPAEAKFYEIFLPAFWRACEKFVIRVRMLVLKLETRLKWLSDNIRGRHINLDVSEKSEYWQNLNGAKKNNKNSIKDNSPPA